MKYSARSLALTSTLVFTAAVADAQVQTGTPPFGSFGGGPDIVNLDNLNVHLDIPVVNKAGRGTNFTYDLSYDTAVWYPSAGTGGATWTPVYNWGWRAITEISTGFISYTQTTTPWCLIGGQYVGQQTAYSNWTYHDPWGVPHYFPVTTYYYQGPPAECSNADSYTSATGISDGYTLKLYGPQVTSLYGTKGQNINAPVNVGTGAASYTDRNGNQITVNGSGQFYDTLSSSTAVLTVAGTGTPSSPITYTYTAPSGAAAKYTMKFATYSVRTNFGCGSVTDYGKNGTTTANLVTEIDLPDNSKYTFSYEQTPGYSTYTTGRLVSVALPTGGTISYTYTGANNGITCMDGSAAGLHRTTPDTGSNYWSYSRTAGSGAAYTTTVTDPQGDVTTIQFQGIYETQRQIYQGASSPSNLLQTITTCYNGNTSNCTSAVVALPITQRNIQTLLSGGLQSEHDDFWNQYGAPTETDDYDHGSAPHGALLKKIVAVYKTNLGNITAFRQSVTTCMAGGTNSSCNNSGTPVSQVTYNYDETTPTTTSGTPQHISVGPPWGNLTSTITYTSSSASLKKSWTYYDTGNANTYTDVNGALTTYNYAAGTPSCSNSFSTSTTEPISGLSTSQTWNCTGGVQTSSTDENSQVTTTDYTTDPYFWRPDWIKDPTGAVTNFCYGLVSGGTCTLNPNQTESTLTFNSNNSTVDKLSTRDSLGRQHVRQTRQAPGSANFDSVETDYDALGRVSRVTLPYTGTQGQTNSSGASITTAYDAMYRPTSIMDGGGGINSYFYGNPGSQNNDVLFTRSPAPSGENTKRRQLEYNGLGQLTSVCELTTMNGSGACSQTNGQTGYWTRYKYDPLGNVLGVCQHTTVQIATDCVQNPSSGQQTRSYAYDFLSRLTSETNPESGTTLYQYDSFPSSCYNFGDNQSGNTTGKTDANGYTNCFHYDSMHRLIDVGSTGTTNNYCKRFRYDFTTNGVDGSAPSGVTVSNIKARLMEAETDNCGAWPPTPITDEWFSYDARGETTNLWESTPHSGSYYPIAANYWANGSLNQLSGVPGLKTITYSADPEGRVGTVSASAGQNPVTGTTYNPAEQVTQLTFGSGSSDGFTYDPNTGRMTQYSFTAGGQSETGTLTWNPNGTPGKLVIADPFNSANSQTCNYTHDDLVRIATASCNSNPNLSQTFSYDPFGNITTSGTDAFQSTYSSSTNRLTQIGSFTPSYDNDGNVLNDSIHTFTWDVYGLPATMDGVTMTYDALGRMAERNNGGSVTEVAYSPAGAKLAIMSGQTLQNGYVPLPNGAVAQYVSNGGFYYRNPDWQGSTRLVTQEGTPWVFSDVAYSPFGVPYALSGSPDYSFTGMNWDTVANLYDFPAREYEYQGRWVSPDPLGKGATCLKDPQTQNRYAYTRNSPLSSTDPTGEYVPFCPPWDPFCVAGGCDPDDPFCEPFPLPFPPVPIGGGGSIGGGGERPRPFPWPLIPPGIFGQLGGSHGTLGPSVTCDCYLAPVSFIPPIQGLGCDYICSCPDGLIFGRIPPNKNFHKCFLEPCPDIVIVTHHPFLPFFDIGDIVASYPPICE